MAWCAAATECDALDAAEDDVRPPGEASEALLRCAEEGEAGAATPVAAAAEPWLRCAAAA
jgi:hypothetical protein